MGERSRRMDRAIMLLHSTPLQRLAGEPMDSRETATNHLLTARYKLLFLDRLDTQRQEK
jgi:hypothetical protein